jgi:hypothetical protein
MNLSVFIKIIGIILKFPSLLDSGTQIGKLREIKYILAWARTFPPAEEISEKAIGRLIPKIQLLYNTTL